MENKRKDKDRRKETDRRCGCTTTYRGPEQRGTRYRRSDKDRRDKGDETD